VTPGYYVAGVCRPEAEAVKLAAANIPPVIWNVDGVLWWHGYTGQLDVSGQPIWQRVSDWQGPNSVSTNSGVGVPGLVACDVEQSVADGIYLGWLVFGVMAAAYGGRLLQRALA